LRGDLIVTVPGRGYRFAGTPAAPAQSIAARPSAAASTGARLFGRDDVLTRLRQVLDQPCCMTIVGPAGVGKTALARSLHEHSSRSRMSIWLDLAALSDDAQILPSLGRALGKPSAGELDDAAQWLPEQPCSIFLDNAEHVVDAVARIVPVLRRATAGHSVLVTSQLPLAIAGERVERLEPLTLPAADATLAEMLAAPSIALFVERIRTADPRFVLGAGSLPQVRAVCAHLDGLPLALEMAAARVPLLGLDKVREALDQRFGLLRHRRRDVPDRHRTLLAALEWSYDLLTQDERRMLQALGVFSSGFTADLALAVAAAGGADRWALLDDLATLVDRSLVAADHADPPRYRLLETMRHFALGKLKASGAEHAVRERQLTALVALTAQGAEAPPGISGDALRRPAIDELGNLQDVIVWATAHDASAAVLLGIHAAAVATQTVWRVQAAEWLGACEPLVGRVEPALRAKWWRQFATQLLFKRSPRVVEAAERAVEACREAGDALDLFWSQVALARALPPGDARLATLLDEMDRLLGVHAEWPPNARAAALGSRALACHLAGDHQGAVRYRRAEIEHLQRHGLSANAAVSELNLAEDLHHLGQTDEALARVRKVVSDNPGDPGVPYVYARMSAIRLLLSLGRADEALDDCPAALDGCRRHRIPLMTEVAALVAARAGRARAAALLLGHAEQAFLSAGMQMRGTGDAEFIRANDAMRAALGAETLQRLIEQGRTMDQKTADAVLFGLDDPAA
jgi:predicted ATPase/tetratricopeptide (TPR) repeat protein